MLFSPFILCLCALSAKKSPFPETSCHIHIWKWYFGTDECVWHCIYQILNSSATLSIGCWQGWKWRQSLGSREVFLAVMISVEMTDMMSKLGKMSSRKESPLWTGGALSWVGILWCPHEDDFYWKTWWWWWEGHATRWKALEMWYCHLFVLSGWLAYFFLWKGFANNCVKTLQTKA